MPDGTFAAYLNLTSLVPQDGKILQGSHDAPHLVRTAKISQAQKTMVLVFHKNQTWENVRFGVDGELVRHRWGRALWLWCLGVVLV